MIIGNNNVFEVGSRKRKMNQPCMNIASRFFTDCEALKVGDNNILECKGKLSFNYSLIVSSFADQAARVGRNVTLTNGCVIGAKCTLTTDEVLPENTVIFGSDHQRRTMPDRPAVILSVLFHVSFRSAIFLLVSNASVGFLSTNFTNISLCFETWNESSSSSAKLISERVDSHCAAPPLFSSSFSLKRGWERQHLTFSHRVMNKNLNVIVFI